MSGAWRFPMALVLEGKRCLVLGSSAEAAFRARSLVECGAVVVVVAPAAGPELQALAASGAIGLEQREFAEADLSETWLVVLADREPRLLEWVGPACRARRILFCAIDQPGHNSAEHLGLVRSGPVTLAISTGGKAPGLAKRLREELERVMRESGFAAFAERVVKLREKTGEPAHRAELERALADLRLGAWDLPGDPRGGRK